MAIYKLYWAELCRLEGKKRPRPTAVPDVRRKPQDVSVQRLIQNAQDAIAAIGARLRRTEDELAGLRVDVQRMEKLRGLLAE